MVLDVASGRRAREQRAARLPRDRDLEGRGDAVTAPVMRPTLSRALASGDALQSRADVAVPAPALLTLPEKRGAVRHGRASCAASSTTSSTRPTGRGCSAAASSPIGSTGSGRDRALTDQDGLYTLVERGLERRRSARDAARRQLGEPRAVRRERVGRGARAARAIRSCSSSSRTRRRSASRSTRRTARTTVTAALVSGRSSRASCTSVRARSTSRRNAASSCCRAS